MIQTIEHIYMQLVSCRVFGGGAERRKTLERENISEGSGSQQYDSEQQGRPAECIRTEKLGGNSVWECGHSDRRRCNGLFRISKQEGREGRKIVEGRDNEDESEGRERR